MNLINKFNKFKESKLKFENNIVSFIDKKILSKRLLNSLLLLVIGSFLYYRFIFDKNIRGGWASIFTAIIYLFLGLGLYGLFRWIVTKIFQMFAYMFRLISRGQLNISVKKGKVSSKLIYK